MAQALAPCGPDLDGVRSGRRGAQATGSRRLALTMNERNARSGMVRMRARGTLRDGRDDDDSHAHDNACHCRTVSPMIRDR